MAKALPELRAYHLTSGVVKINEARTKWLGLEADPKYGEMTVPEFLAANGGSPSAPAANPEAPE